MAIKYDIYQNVNTQGTKYPKYHTRPVKNGVQSEKEFFKHLAHHISFSPEVLEAVMGAVEDAMVEMLSEGLTVQLGKIGSFQVTLKSPEARDPSEIRAGSVKVNGVSFRPRKRFLNEVKSSAKLERARYKNHSQQLSDNELEALIVNYLKENGSIIRRQLEEIALLTHSTAITRLRKLVAKGVIHNISGDPKHPVYELTKK